MNNGKYKLILVKIENEDFVLSVINKSIDDVDIERTDEEKELKRKEFVFVDQNSFMQNGTPLSGTASKGNLAQKTDSVRKIINSSVSR